jgi:hypothetical protein
MGQISRINPIVLLAILTNSSNEIPYATENMFKEEEHQYDFYLYI